SDTEVVDLNDDPVVQPPSAVGDKHRKRTSGKEAGDLQENRVAQPLSAVHRETASHESQVEEDWPTSHTRVAQALLPVHGRHRKGSEYEESVATEESRVAQPPSAVEGPGKYRTQHFPFTFSESTHSPWSKRKPGHDDKPPQKVFSVSPCLRGEKSV